MQSGTEVNTFWSNILPPSTTLKMQIVCFSEIFAPTYQTTRCHDTESHNTDPYRSLNLQLYISNLSLATVLLGEPR